MFPAKWAEYQNEQEALRTRHQNRRLDHESFHQYLLIATAPVPNNVSMPADTLETIIRAIGFAPRPPAPALRPPPAPRHAPRRPAPPQVSNRGRGNNGGRGRGREPANRRGRRGNRTEDPRRNRRVDVNQDQSSIQMPAPAPTCFPGAVPPEPISNPAVDEITDASNAVIIDTTAEIEGLEFLEEFANTNISNVGDIMMNNESVNEGEFSA